MGKKRQVKFIFKSSKTKSSWNLGQYTIIGNKNDCIDKLEQIYKANVLTFYDFFNDTKFFSHELNILPKIKKF